MNRKITQNKIVNEEQFKKVHLMNRQLLSESCISCNDVWAESAGIPQDFTSVSGHGLKQFNGGI